MKIRQPLQLVYEWRYLVLAVDVVKGRIYWTWTETLKGQELLGAVGALPEVSDLKAIVWDRAPGHLTVERYELGLDAHDPAPTLVPGANTGHQPTAADSHQHPNRSEGFGRYRI